MVYLVGSLRNPAIPLIANDLRESGFEVFDDWYAAGPEADDKWKDYEQRRGRSYAEALKGLAAEHVFEFDLLHLKRADTVVLVMPAGKSGFMELGWALGQGKKGYILLDDPERWDVMLKFATGVTAEYGELVEWLKEDQEIKALDNTFQLHSGWLDQKEYGHGV
jgi:nucleoside 2-deoxyribosyltransferase